MPDYQFIEIEHKPPIANIKLNRPGKLNALNSGMRQELTASFANFGNDAAIKAIILSGAGGKAFSAGQDLEEAQQFTAQTAADWMDETITLFKTITTINKPLVAAVEGVAAGAGFQLALLCDIRVGCAEGRMGQPEIVAGIPSIIGAELMRPFLGQARTTELTLTGRLMDGAECKQLGLLHYLVAKEEVLSSSVDIASSLAAKPAVALQATIRNLRRLALPDFVTLREVARQSQYEAFATGEPQKVIAEILARRKK